MKAEILFLKYLIVCIRYFLYQQCEATLTDSYRFTDIPSIFPHRLNQPGLESPHKLWWAKEITPGFHVCGRLSRHELKMAVDAGFKSILSLFTYPDGDPEGDFGGESLPTTEVERRIVEDTLGLQFVNLLDPLDEWSSVEAVEKFTAMAPHLKKPALLRCDRGYTIAFVTLLYLANQTRLDPHFQPRVTGESFYKIARSMGLDFLSRIPMEVVEEVTGEPEPMGDSLIRLAPKYEPVDWLDFWYAHPVYNNWFITGQIAKSHLGPLSEFGYKSVINLRLGLTFEGSPSQEEVNLLNIKSGTGTYNDETTLPRQSVDRLRQTRIDERRSKHFISQSSDVNFELENQREFGDEIGYNENLERRLFEDIDLEYVHMPLKSKDDLGVFFKKHRDKLIEVSQRGPVLVHCSDGSRAAYVSVLTSAVQYDLSLDWALRRLKEMGFGVGSDKNPSVFQVYQNLLKPHTASRTTEDRDEL